MSYPRTLDEIPTGELVRELEQRQRKYERGNCPYCEKPLQFKKNGMPYCVCRFGDTETYHLKK